MADLPKSVASNIIHIAGLPLRCYVLDNGMRVIDADDAERFFKMLETGEAEITAEQADELARFIKQDSTKESSEEK
jgi:UDP-N-acetyl-D-mannosaminuronate dehydrogenase